MRERLRLTTVKVTARCTTPDSAAVAAWAAGWTCATAAVVNGRTIATATASAALHLEPNRDCRAIDMSIPSRRLCVFC